MSRRLTAGVLIAIVVVAFCIRLALAVAQVRTNWFVTHGIPVYAGWAFNIAEFGRFDFVEGSMTSQLYAAMAPLKYPRLVDPVSIIERGEAVFPQPPGGIVILQPGHGFVMGLIWALTRDYRFITIVVGQALLDALTCLLAFAVGRQLWGPAGGIAGAVGYAIFTPQAQLTAYAGANVWTAPLLLLLCWQLSKTPGSLSGVKRFWIYNAISIGIVLGVGTMTFSPYAALIAPIGPIALRYFAWRKALAWFTVVAITFGCVLVPWSLRVLRVTGEFRPVPPVFWYNVHWGLIEQPDSPFGDDEAFGWPREEELVMLHFKQTRGVKQVQTTEADKIYRTAVIEMLAEDLEYAIAITAARFASILLMSGPNDSVPHSLYTLGADMSIYTRQSLSCYQQTFDARSDFSLCDGDYIGLNPWPEQTHSAIEWLVWIVHPLRISIDGIGAYGNAGDATFGVLPLAIVGLVIAWRRRAMPAAAFAVVALAWPAVFAINHVEPRYVAGGQALLWIAACASVAGLASSATRIVKTQTQPSHHMPG